MNRPTVACLLTTALIGASASAGRAQDVPASPAATAQEPAQPAAAAAPPPPAWHGSASFSIMFEDGVQAQRGHQFNAAVKRPFSDGGSFVAQLGRQYQKVTFPSESQLADRFSSSIGVDQDFPNNTVFIARSLYLRDQTLLINSRYEELFGYGLSLRNRTRTIEFQLVPGISIYNENLTFVTDDGWKTAAGFFEKFAGKFNKVWSVDNSFRFRHDFAGAKLSIESVATVAGMFSKLLGMQLEYQYNYESVVPEDVPNYLQLLSAGLKFQF